MTLSRRDFLKLASLVSASAALSSCAPVYRRIAGDLPTLPWAALGAGDFLALNRLTFGPRVEERARFSEIGLQNYIEEQLDFESINDFDCDLQLMPFKTIRMDANEIEGVSNQLFDGYDRERAPQELRQATLLRQMYSKRQLYEVMTEFWSDHFNIFMDKEKEFFLKSVDDREVIRKHALGNFRDLVWASAHSPAMLVYLDNQANEQSHPNENYARELMELHTLGVDGGYSQQDVMELARCLTGWKVKEHFWLGEFTFDKNLHDTGTKNVLGLSIQPSGVEEAEQVIEMLVKHPSTARFISTKLARRFLADDPPQEIIEKAAQTFLATKGDIKSVLRVILLDGLPLAQPKYKRPVNFVLSAMRMLNVETDAAALHDYLVRMGQVAFNWPTPDGYPDRSEPWQGNLMPRWQFAFALIRNEINDTKHNLQSLLDVASNGILQDDVDSITSLLLGTPLERVTRDGLIDTVRAAGSTEEETLQVITASIIASPAFQWR
ncbi:DUF1800 domain-containing protein [Candidatus Villigracilis affinis]|uniref:DUF1800 domain-containing protein n=1 Tax=Candidatus Villigracilis affinis TaxID=3140682 RepID=UPI001D67140C|nr:DUF1800 domain-containing protein [Anaerolineales bacterium]